jgi:hypothetical protein
LTAGAAVGALVFAGSVCGVDPVTDAVRCVGVSVLAALAVGAARVRRGVFAASDFAGGALPVGLDLPPDRIGAR